MEMSLNYWGKKISIGIINIVTLKINKFVPFFFPPF